MMPVRIDEAIARLGVELVPIERRPRLNMVGRHPFPVLDLRTRHDDGFSARFDDKFQWVRDLYASDLPLRDFTLLCARNVVVWRGSVWCEGAVIEGTLPPKHARDEAALPRWTQKFEKISKSAEAIKGRTAIIHAAGYRNFFHWTVEIMPRLFALREGLRSGAIELDQIVLFYDEPFRFVGESIAALLPELEPLIVIKPSGAALVEQCYFFVDGSPGSEYQDHQAHTSRLKVCTAFLSEEIDDRHAKAPREKGRAILISRADAPKRKFRSEDAILDTFSDLGLERVPLGELTIAGQIELMSKADLLVGAHGAGLTNALYCRPGTVLVEINSSRYIKRCRLFADIAMYRRLHYGLAIADSVPASSAGAEEDPDIALEGGAESLAAIRKLADDLMKLRGQAIEA